MLLCASPAPHGFAMPRPGTAGERRFTAARGAYMRAVDQLDLYLPHETDKDVIALITEKRDLYYSRAVDIDAVVRDPAPQTPQVPCALLPLRSVHQRDRQTVRPLSIGL